MGGAAANAPGSGLPLPAQTRGDQLLSGFKTATEIAAEIGNFESWAIELPYRSPIVEAVQNNPPEADRVMSANKLQGLLLSESEQERMRDLVDTSRELKLAQFIGAEITARTTERGQIRQYRSPNSYHPLDEDSYILTSRRPKKVSAKIASLHPARGVIRVASAIMNYGKHSSIVGGIYYDVSPFDAETGERVADIELK
jgi:hypothetical protein